MNEQFSDIFTETACPSQEQLMAYVQDQLSPEERHKVELHLADCEMCSEAVEGLMAIRQKEQIPVWLRQAKWNVLQQLRRKTHKKRKVNFYLYIAIVALIIIFLVLALFWLFHFFNTAR
jgi:hypothetical protein